MKNFNVGVMSSYTEGDVVLPFEQSVTLRTSLKNFALMMERQFSALAVNRTSDSSEVNFVMNAGSQFDEPFMTLKLTVQKDPFRLNNEGILEVLSYSNIYQKRGKRAVFMALTEEDNDYEVFTVLLGRNIYYSDFRVTLNFPGNTQEEDQLVSDIGQRLVKENLQFEIETIE